MALEELVREDEDDYEDDERRNRSVLAAAAVVTVIAVVAAWLIWPRGGDTPATGQPDPAPLADGCPTMPSNENIPTTAPPVTWEVFNGAVLPVSAEHGPAVVEGPIARCYSHTPTGALIAAVQINVRSLVDPAGGLSVVREQMVPGEGREALAEALRKRGAPGEVSGTPVGFCQVAGYRFVTYTPEEAVVALAADCGQAFQVTELRVQWRGGDWHQVREPDGSSSPTVASARDLRGFTVWRGV